MTTQCRLDRKMGIADGWKVSILLFAITACISSLCSSFYNVSSERLFSSNPTSFSAKNVSPKPCVQGMCTDDMDVASIPSSSEALSPLFSTAATAKDDSMCGSIGSRSVLNLWMAHADLILKESRLPADPQFSEHNMMLEMLIMVSPRLPNSLRIIPRTWDTVERVLRRGWTRYRYLQRIQNSHHVSQPTDEPPIIQILVFGGSVTHGHSCIAINGVTKGHCAWPSRLESLVNGLAGGMLVQVHNLAIPSTMSSSSQGIWEKGLFPDEAKNPDIVINAHSTNDSVSTPFKERRESIFDMAQSFIRSVMGEKSCSEQPLLIWLDDFLGGNKDKIKDQTILPQEIQVLANYYGFLFVSFANVVRDWVYGDTHGILYSPNWYKTSNVFKQNVHPEQGMHLVTSWIMLYNLLNLAATHCSIEAWNKKTGTSFTSPHLSFLPAYNTSDQIKIPKATYYRTTPAGLPPILTNNLSLHEVTDKWRADAQDRLLSPKKCSKSSLPQCIFSWISGLESEETSESIEAKFAPFMKYQGNWSIVDDTGKKKFGWVPAEIGSEMLLEFQNLTQSVSTVTVFPMKSYGEKWFNSSALFHVHSQIRGAASWSTMAKLNISGIHTRNTSEIYTINIDMPSAVPANANMQINVKFTGGTTFKLMGLVLCS